MCLGGGVEGKFLKLLLVLTYFSVVLHYTIEDGAFNELRVGLFTNGLLINQMDILEYLNI